MGMHEDDRIRRKNAQYNEPEITVFCSGCGTEFGYPQDKKALLKSETCPSCERKLLYSND